MKSINAGYVKIYDANPEVLKALPNSSLPVVITVANINVPGMASSTTTSGQRLRTNLLPYYPHMVKYDPVTESPLCRVHCFIFACVLSKSS
ncbi:hypothetical protein SUGI_1523830 [Cryptomeria japonica]|uniref:Uncharacterized protein n=1 Tax=Cryptomeria japonica TaxID=3369 RepID=A0AAD3NUI1_CRYJA|nr:hypothetical protein SUGI_0103670 [Cryptomeria japonica]GLJ59806.1 hypothetical protein SUGI_1523830 [Cryptomeria japonica]